jgi:Flp pilus assembly protein TadB
MERTMTPTPDTTRARDQRTIGRLVSDLALDTSRLLRAEIDRAKAEFAERAQTAAGGVGVLVAALWLVCIVLALLVVTALFALALWVPEWAAALIMAGITLVVALILASIGVRMLKSAGPIAPVDSYQNAREDIEWLAQQQTSRSTSTS